MVPPVTANVIKFPTGAGKVRCPEAQSKIGIGVVIEPGAVIEADQVELGDFAFIGRDVRIKVPVFRMGEYSKLHAFSFLYGHKPMQIGRNCWIGEHTVLDSHAGLDIFDNVGIGAHSQVWTHIQHGDTVEGCRFHSSRYASIGEDAWLVGHCIMSPIRMAPRSMALAGSVLTKDTLPNHVYAGTPARDVTDKMGPQFEDRTAEEKTRRLVDVVQAFERRHPKFAGFMGVATPDQLLPKGNSHVTWINAATRTYTKRLTEAEVTFRKEHPLLRVKPAGESPFVEEREPS